MNDEYYMSIALALAEKGCGLVKPNPMVGAVIVKDDQIIGQGYHEKFGGLHAERNAINSCTTSPIDSTLYVTLEPCCHWGKTSPCTEAIIKSGIKKVVIGSKDPNPLVSGKGIQILQENNIEVKENILEPQCNKLNQIFFHYISTKKPFVVMKYAMTMDGKIATVTGKSKWITSDLARLNVHKDRSKYSSIMVGVNTIINDDPLLTCRISSGINPIRIICDTNLRTPLESKVVSTAKDTPTYIATCCYDEEKQKPFIDMGCNLIHINKKHNHVDLNELMIKLGSMGVDSVFLEGGSTLNYSAIECGIVNKIQAYIAPKIFGGSTAATPLSGSGVKTTQEAFTLKDSNITILGDDILIECEVCNRCSQE